LGHEHTRIKDSTQSLRFWNEEIKHMKKQIEEFTGNKITRQKLKEAIEISHRATKAFRRLQDCAKVPSYYGQRRHVS
jgi:benzoyl-CoA reductase/2-hydroxyglutaryl-CoA dehydratase subunit BcrC/BadD/HgdB